ncbi:MAG: hypothetical protein ABIJ09_01295 [Pseudomonadota bacterium]
MATRRVLFGWSALVLVLLGSPAWAGSLEDGIAAYNAMDYTRAEPLLGRAAADPALPRPDRSRAALLMGIIRLTLGEHDLAQRHFVEAVTLDPMLELPPDVSPKVRDLIEQARTRAAAAPASPAQDPAPEPSLDTAPLAPQPGVETPAAALAPSTAPAASAAEAPESDSVWSSPWLWAGLGAAAIATAGVTTVVVLLALNQGTPPPDPGPSCDAPAGSGCVKVNF